MTPLHRRSVPLSKAHYITGLFDEKGSFDVSFRKRDDLLLGWKVTPVFNITQKKRVVLSLVKHYLGCGTIRSRKNGVWVYEVDNTKALIQCVIPFFNSFPFLSQEKKKHFENFQKIVKINPQKDLFTLSNLNLVLELLKPLQLKSSRKHGKKEIVERAQLFWERNREKVERINRFGLESSETTRQTQPSCAKRFPSKGLRKE